MTNRILILLLLASVTLNAYLLLREDPGNTTPPPDDVPAVVIETPAAGTYPFIRVIDGNTVAIGYSGRTEHVRLLGIRAPEPNVPGGPECQASEAIAHLRATAQTGTVVLSFDTEHGPRDTMGRLTGYVELPDGTDLGESILRDGFARQFSSTGTHERYEAYREAEQFAIQNQLGLWDPELCP